MSIVRLLELGKIAFLLLPFWLSLPQVARAESEVIEIVEYEDVDEALPEVAPLNPAALAKFGPFQVVGPDIAELYGSIDQDSVGQFQRMIADYPGIKQLRMLECPGTENDEANLAVARMIRKQGISTHVPAQGSIRSGGVELFLAGVKRSADPGAEFGVHSWQDEDGREARDVPMSDPVHEDYLRYYQEMGLAPDQAKAFYAFTNATRFDDVHYMTRDELTRFQLLN